MQIHPVKETFVYIGQFIIGLAFYAMLLGSMFVADTFWLCCTAAGAASYTFSSSFALAKTSLKRGIYAALVLATPTAMFAILGLGDWVVDDNPRVFMFWFSVALALVFIGFLATMARARRTSQDI
ncbi:hypothetical protein [Neiella marina]|nr:hypothetical protein [Neiella marina]